MKRARLIAVIASVAVALSSFGALACTRFLYQTETNNFIVGRSMDWAEDPGTDLWSFPRGLKRDGGAGPGSIEWTSKYGSVISSFYNIAG
jgi:penicillin V acylase-like amidase (Ntn superfamily)